MSSDKSFDMGTGERGRFFYDKETGTFKRRVKPVKVETHAVIQDTMPVIESNATAGRQKFDSKSAYRRHLKALGFRETGEAPRGLTFADVREYQAKEERDRRDDIEKAYFDAKYDRIEFTEQEKENHLREERACRAQGLPTKLRAPR